MNCRILKLSTLKHTFIGFEHFYRKLNFYRFSRPPPAARPPPPLKRTSIIWSSIQRRVRPTVSTYRLSEKQNIHCGVECYDIYNNQSHHKVPAFVLAFNTIFTLRLRKSEGTFGQAASRLAGWSDWPCPLRQHVPPLLRTRAQSLQGLRTAVVDLPPPTP